MCSQFLKRHLIPKGVPQGICHTQCSHRSLFIASCWKSRKGCHGSARVGVLWWSPGVGVPRQCHMSWAGGAMAVPHMPGCGAVVVLHVLGSWWCCVGAAVPGLGVECWGDASCPGAGIGVPRRCRVCQGWCAAAAPYVPGFRCHGRAKCAMAAPHAQGHGAALGLGCHGSASCARFGVPRWTVAVPPIPGPWCHSGPTWCHPPNHSGSERSGISAKCPAARGTSCPPCGIPAPRRAAAPPPAPWRC